MEINIIFRASDADFDKDKLCADSGESQADVGIFEIYSNNAARKPQGDNGRRAAAHEWVENYVARVGRSQQDAFEQSNRLLRGVLAEAFLFAVRRRNLPDAFHLLATGLLLHQFVMEGVAGLLALRGPDDRLGGVGEVPAGKVGRRVGLHPGDVVQQLEAKLLHGKADRVDDVAGAADPDGAVRLEHALAGG